MKCRDLHGSRGDSWNHRSSLAGNVGNAVGLGLGAVLGDVANLTASVAGLASLAVEWAAVRSGAVAGDVAELAAGVAFHSLSLAIARIVVGSAALVASRRAWNTARTSGTAKVATESSAATAASAKATAHGTTNLLRWWNTSGCAASTSAVTLLRCQCPCPCFSSHIVPTAR